MEQYHQYILYIHYNSNNYNLMITYTLNITPELLPPEDLLQVPKAVILFSNIGILKPAQQMNHQNLHRHTM